MLYHTGHTQMTFLPNGLSYALTEHFYAETTFYTVGIQTAFLPYESGYVE
jgi:hypothetical protein